MFSNIFNRSRALFIALMLIAVSGLPALPDRLKTRSRNSPNDDFSDTQAAVGAVATSGNPQAYAIISALQDGRLFADAESKKVFIKTADDKVLDAATGAPVAEMPADASAVRLNNRLRAWCPPHSAA